MASRDDEARQPRGRWPSDPPEVPKPAVLTLLGVGLAAVGLRRRKVRREPPAA